MRRALILVLGLVLAACAGGQGGAGEFRLQNGERGRLRPIAEPGEVVAAEVAFQQAAREKGQWTAFAQFAADEGIMFVPQPVLAKAWLKGRANPAQAVEWQPYQVWSSCDGSLAVTKGAWQRPNSVGYFTTIWQRQKNGAYKWVYDGGDGLDKPLAEPELVAADVADCPAGAFAGRPTDRRGPAPMATIAGTLEDRTGTSADGTLAWVSNYAKDGSRTLSVSLRKGGAMTEVLVNRVAP